jgi:sugar/nucleoside kinase (ribokinase family)
MLIIYITLKEINQVNFMKKQGLFVGLVTVDLLYLTANFPDGNQKIVAIDYNTVAGGPATNASVTFSYLGNQAKLLTVLGQHPLTNLVINDLQTQNIEIIDLDSQKHDPPPVSSIIITEKTGDRAVISINAVKSQAPIENIPDEILKNIDIVLIDGHQMKVGTAIAQKAKSHNIKVVIDGGSWKDGFQELLPSVNYAICSDNFYPPNCQQENEVFNYLLNKGINHIAITHGSQAITYISDGQKGTIEIAKIQSVDTLGAGDIFHGAFCHYILTENFINALIKASQIASYSCQFFGTRTWLNSDKKQ